MYPFLLSTTLTDQAVLHTLTLDHILSVLEKKGVAYWWDGPIDEFVPLPLLEDGRSALDTWRKGTDNGRLVRQWHLLVNAQRGRTSGSR